MRRVAVVQPVSVKEPSQEGNLSILAVLWRHRIKHIFVTLTLSAVVLVPFALADKAFLAYAILALVYRLDSRYSFGLSLALLVAIPVDQALHVADEQVNAIVIYVFYMLCLGVIQVVLETRWPKAIVMHTREVDMSEDRTLPLRDIPMLAPSGPRDTMIRPRPVSRRQSAPLVPASISGLPTSNIVVRNLSSIYRLLIFPIIVVGLGYASVVYGSPLVQPQLDNLYARPEGVRFANTLESLAHKQARLKAAAAAPNPSPLPSTAPLAFDRTTTKVQIQNGNGIVGSAAKTATKLIALGYVISPTDITNAAELTHQTTEIYSASPSIAAIVAKDMGINNYVPLRLQSTQFGYTVVIITGAAL